MDYLVFIARRIANVRGLLLVALMVLYLAYPAPHTPWLLSEEFVGKIGAGVYSDFVMMADIERFGHDSETGLRCMKSDVWEGGHRMPFIVRWPDKVKAGSISDRLICFTDLLATFAAALGVELPADDRGETNNLNLRNPDAASRLTAEMNTIVDDGHSRVASNEADRSTLTGKVMVGYQGWFNCEGDGADLGWTHWWRSRRKPFGPGNVSVDLWPDVSELDEDERFATGFKHADGSTAAVFSSGNRKTVLRHFQWMRDYGIDGAFLQRFANGLKSLTGKRQKNNVLSHVREGAEKAGRSYAVMYDLSGLAAGGCQIVRDDWSKLHSESRITDDAAYQRHAGKPVVGVWGVGFNDGIKPRKYSLAECRDLIEFLKEDGCAVMLGVPTGWRELERDALDSPELHAVLQLADVISPWTPGRYRDLKGVARHADKFWQPDIEWCGEHKLDYMPVVFPGFSWHNMKDEKLDAIPRLKGQFLWSQIAAAKRAGCDMLYVAMFDEVDEGTAIFKCTNDPPTGDGVEFLTYEGLPSDYYLRLTGMAGKWLRGEVALSDEIPVRPDDH